MKVSGILIWGIAVPAATAAAWSIWNRKRQTKNALCPPNLCIRPVRWKIEME